MGLEQYDIVLHNEVRRDKRLPAPACGCFSSGNPGRVLPRSDLRENSGRLLGEWLNLSQAFILADAGYDVWLGNTRGSTYSKEHVSLQSTDNEFWDFSWHESGVYDLPAMIDYVLSTTSQSNLYYIGHSMGTTMFYVMASMRPEYNAKIRAQFSLAPVAFMSNLKSPVIRLMSTFEDTLEILMKMIGMHEFLPNSEFLTLVGGVFCNDDAITQQLCDNILFLLCGYDQDQLNTTALPVLLGHIPAGASTNQMVHYAQGVNSVFLHWSDNDLMADPKDVRELNGKLPNVKGSIRVPYAAFNHLDYMWAIDGKTLVYDTVLENMKKY
uniref:AB hydrolase-1 domain-containing protein n=1 Tax=Timema poppense TaxID=170557 RepID=A0A7R9HBM6_TIMPO|nr:unnamed protein product [Timema poppensis]